MAEEKIKIMLGNMMVIRKKKKISQKVLSEVIGTTEAQISRIEKGEQFPKVDTIVKIAIALDVSIDELLKDVREHFENENIVKKINL